MTLWNPDRAVWHRLHAEGSLLLSYAAQRAAR